MTDIAAFISARLEDDQRGAGGCMNCGLPIRRDATATGWTHGDRGAVGGGWQGVRCPGKITGALPWPDPARVLREVAAKRARLALWLQAIETMDPLLADDDADPVERAVAIGRAQATREAVLADGAVWSDHPDYNPGWAPVAEDSRP